MRHICVTYIYIIYLYIYIYLHHDFVSFSISPPVGAHLWWLCFLAIMSSGAVVILVCAFGVKWEAFSPWWLPVLIVPRHLSTLKKKLMLNAFRFFWSF